MTTAVAQDIQVVLDPGSDLVSIYFDLPRRPTKRQTYKSSEIRRDSPINKGVKNFAQYLRVLVKSEKVSFFWAKIGGTDPEEREAIHILIPDQPTYLITQIEKKFRSLVRG